MPFVLAPNLWASISRSARKPFEAVERDHGDGIAVNLDSPEAFDEVFWRILCGKSYIRADGLLPHRPGAQAIARYRDFIRLVLRRRGKSRYLTKCNNNILRLGTLPGAMPDCTFLLVIRAPLTHADSLLRQHRRSAQSTDRFGAITFAGLHTISSESTTDRSASPTVPSVIPINLITGWQPGLPAIRRWAR